MQEMPAIRVYSPGFIQSISYNKTEVDRQARQLFDNLPKDTQDEIMSLAAHYRLEEEGGHEIDLFMAIFHSNVQTLGIDIGLFVKSSRINHSYRPNAGYS